MKKFFALVLSGFVFFRLVPVAWSGTGESIQAIVNTQIVSIEVDPTTPIDYGTLGYGEYSAPSHEITVTNNGTVSEDFEIRGEEATDGQGHTWTLSQGIGYDIYSHLYGRSPYADSDFSYLSTNNVDLETGVLPGDDSVAFETKLRMPTGSSGMGQYSTYVHVRATIAD